MRLKIKRIISLFLFLCILLCSIQKVVEILEDKSRDEIFDTYFEVCDDIDVQFVGASRVTHQIYPLNLWDDYGITSYNTAVNGSRPQCWYWIMRETLKYHIPKLLVVDVSLLSFNMQIEFEGTANQIFDAFPLDYTKIREAFDFEEKNPYVDFDPWNIIFNINKYHDRWTNLSESDFKSINDKTFNAF